MNRALFLSWRFLGSINLTVGLCLALTVNLIWGYFSLNRRTPLFTPLNDMGLIPWMQTYGVHNLAATGWFFLLMILLALLAGNTFVCTTNRVVQLLTAGSDGKGAGHRKWLALKLAPHIMHYGLIVILVGYLVSYLCTNVLTGRTLVPGFPLSLPGASGQVTLLAFEPEYYQGQRLAFWRNEVIAARARLLLDDGTAKQEAILSCTRPVRFQGYSLHLRNFAPKSQGGMKMKTRVDLYVRKDPGVALYLAGIALFTLGLALYVYEWVTHREATTE
ncbi:MAG: hypothetical protein LBD10_06225 [Desulfobulbus sp.]|jgi:hypothetical protein|uniref:hypothetical protein n=1 Tax=Desulfobulbus sp. TaxID=895 RepID=UPI00283FC20E|nr:hypothetical protein [Desulfobulbus sp.]MDR2549774.1 hypothetical protein [Desulfobulbus sp.]